MDIVVRLTIEISDESLEAGFTVDYYDEKVTEELDRFIEENIPPSDIACIGITGHNYDANYRLLEADITFKENVKHKLATNLNYVGKEHSFSFNNGIVYMVIEDDSPLYKNC